MDFIFIIVWAIVGLYFGVKYGDLWSMFITLPMSMLAGPLTYIYYKFFHKL